MYIQDRDKIYRERKNNTAYKVLLGRTNFTVEQINTIILLEISSDFFCCFIQLQFNLTGTCFSCDQKKIMCEGRKKLVLTRRSAQGQTASSEPVLFDLFFFQCSNKPTVHLSTLKKIIDSNIAKVCTTCCLLIPLSVSVDFITSFNKEERLEKFQFLIFI